jgi:hypothetical protein
VAQQHPTACRPRRQRPRHAQGPRQRPAAARRRQNNGWLSPICDICEVVGIGPLRQWVLDHVDDPCVDKIDIRRLIWAAVKNKADFFADGRMYAT